MYQRCVTAPEARSGSGLQRRLRPRRHELRRSDATPENLRAHRGEMHGEEEDGIGGEHDQSGHSMPAYTVGEPMRRMLAGWCSVFHQSTENLMIGILTTPTRSAPPRRETPARIVEGAPKRDQPEIQEEQYQHDVQPRIPHPPGAPHRFAPEVGR